MRVAVVLDCLQPDRLAQFWAAALGYRRAPSGGPYVVLVPDRQPGPERGLQRRLLRGPTAGPGRAAGRAPLRHRRLRVLARPRPRAAGRAGEPAAGRDALAEVLLAPLAPEVYQYQRQGRGRTPAEITGALVRLARAVLGPPEPG